MRTFSPEHLQNLTSAQHTRKMNKNNGTGFKNIRKYKNSYIVEVTGSYIGCTPDLEKAKELVKESRCKVFGECAG